MKVLRVDPERPEEALMVEAAEVVLRGGVIGYPTDTLYGLAVDPFSPAAVGRLFLAKARDEGRGLPLVASDTEQILSELGPLPAVAQALARRFWPGPLTILMAAPAALPTQVSAGTSLVGVRVPAHAVARDLCRAAGSVLIATSANRSGQPATNEASRLTEELLLHIDVLLDAGPTAGGPPSTIIDVSSGEPQLVRAGAIPFEVIRTWRG